MRQATCRLTDYLRAALALAASSQMEGRKALRKLASHLRRRLVRVAAARQLLMSKDATRNQAAGRWPRMGDTHWRSPNDGLAALAERLNRS